MTTDDIAALARARFGSENPRLSSRNELRFGNRGSVSVALIGEKAGLFYDHESGTGGALRPDDAPREPRPQSPPRPKSPLTWDSPSEPQFREALRTSIPIASQWPARGPDTGGRTIGAMYMHRRGITDWPDHSVRGWGMMGITYVARTLTGEPLAVQVMHLRVDGTKNDTYWRDGVVKRTYAAARGWHHFAAVRLPGRGELILCEGVETGLSVWLATGRPVACCLGVAGVRHLRTGKRVTIARDLDLPKRLDDGTVVPPASDAAYTAAVNERLTRGQRIRVATPPAGIDFNDIHREHGLAAVAEYIRRAINV
jgi:hypothetical protein